MGKLDLTTDGLPDEAFAAIHEISKSLKFMPKVVVVAGGYDGNSTLRYLQLFPDAQVYFLNQNKKIMKKLS